MNGRDAKTGMSGLHNKVHFVQTDDNKYR